MGALRLAIDVMGGDQGPRVIIEGSARAVIERPDLELALFGPRQRVVAELSRLPQPAHCEAPFQADPYACLTVGARSPLRC